MINVVRRSAAEIYAHPARVISRTFNPGHEDLLPGVSRAQAVMARVIEMDKELVAITLANTLAEFANRHDDLRATFRRNFNLVAPNWVANEPELSQEQVELIGAYFTQEYSIEGAALFNPSIVEAPDQEGCPPGSLRFIMSLRAVGEGHISSIEFRSGILNPNDEVLLDPVSPHLSTGERVQITTRSIFSSFGPAEADIESSQVDLAYTYLPQDLGYQIEFAQTSVLSERVLFPGNHTESHGLEDTRLVRFVETDGSVCYYGTYTAYNGTNVAPHLLQTDDFVTFTMRPMSGQAAANKGMALFPRRIAGKLWCISRWDRENISVAFLDENKHWSNPQQIQSPSKPWELVQMGACSSPIETSVGWLVLTHGVGPMRTYAISALLLDLHDPTKTIGVLDTPLMLPAENERNGYVPNVVYSCGALIHGDSIVLPYGCSDVSVRFAFINLTGLLEQLTGDQINSDPIEDKNK